ncbi:MAG: hypothetical protein ACE5KQ_02190 [Thermoplasmata archaeon]
MERGEIRTKEVYCPDDERLADPLAAWTGSTWIPLPGRGVTSAWCRKERRDVSLESLEAIVREGSRGEVTVVVCPSCGSEIARRNRWKYWEPFYLNPSEAAR